MKALSFFAQNRVMACRRLLFLCASSVILAACDLPPEDSTEQASISMPEALQRASFPADGNLTASITVDPQSGGGAKPMKESGGVLSFSDKITKGEHQFLLELFYESNSVEKLRLVSAEKTVSVSGATDIQFRERDYQYENTDDDFYIERV